MSHHNHGMNPTQGMVHNMSTTMNMNHHGGAGEEHGMKMYFHASKMATILFEGWQVDSVGGIFGSCVAIFIIAALYEGLKVVREGLRRKYNLSGGASTTHQKQNGTQLPHGSHVHPEVKEATPRSRIFNWHHILQSFLHILQVFISYCLMLVFMTYNVWLCLAVLLGAGCGHFFFGWKLNTVVDIYEHCH